MDVEVDIVEEGVGVGHRSGGGSTLGPEEASVGFL